MSWQEVKAIILRDYQEREIEKLGRIESTVQTGEHGRRVDLTSQIFLYSSLGKEQLTMASKKIDDEYSNTGE